MSEKVEHYIERYRILSSRLCRTEDDYTEAKVAKHNRAMKELNRLIEEINSDRDIALKVYETLLESTDLQVQQMAATDCLIKNMHIDRSVEILKFISKHGDRMSAMGAQRRLKIWKGEIGENDPF
ncbi:MAG: hypothetical protein J6J21_01975 [Clostridia bacterium]|nr:hypothetical protein [Clostridia bacterium]